MLKTLSPKKTTLFFATFISLILLIFCFSQRANASTAFVTTWQTDKGQPGSKTITIPVVANEEYDYFVNWGDGNTSDSQTGSATHTYENVGVYRVSISGKFPRIYFNNGLEKEKILTVESWGSIQWSSMVDAFEGCANLTIQASDAPDLSRVASMSGMFRGASSFNQSINHWDVSHVTSIANMFEKASSFNQPLNHWDTSNVSMFSSAFRRASSFNQDLQSWNTSNAKTTYAMFAYATTFDKPLATWDMSGVNDIRDMFAGAISFNQDLSDWDTSNVIRTESMFRNAIRFNQDISNWNFSKVTNAGYMFSGTRLSGQNYDKLLSSLANGTVLDNVVLDAGSSTYCTGGEARRRLIENKNWTINDQGQDPNSCSSIDIQFESGVGAVIDENKPEGTVIGKLVTIHPNPAQQFNYSFCANGTYDQQFFEIRQGTIYALTSFDYEKPLDEDKDNVLNLCITSTDQTGARIQRVVTVAVVDLEDNDVQPNQQNGGTEAGGTAQQGVLGASTSSGGNVLGKVLGATGIAGILITSLGAILISTVILLEIKTRHKSIER